MTVEERLRSMLGDQTFQIAVLLTQLEEANKRVAELEKEKKAREPSKPDDKPDLHAVS